MERKECEVNLKPHTGVRVTPVRDKVAMCSYDFVVPDPHFGALLTHRSEGFMGARKNLLYRVWQKLVYMGQENVWGTRAFF